VNFYAYAMLNPTRHRDPSGLDIYYMLDVDAAHGEGHAAVIIGQGDNYSYHSFGNQDAGKPFGPGEYIEKDFDNLDDARAFARSQYGFDAWAHMEASEGQDEAARAAARKYRDKDHDYNVLGHNCARMSAEAADAAGYSGLNGHPKASFRRLQQAGYDLPDKP
jgi:hypothetical protein